MQPTETYIERLLVLLYLSWWSDPFDERHVETIVHTVKIVSAQDSLIVNISRKQLHSVVYRCLNDDPDNEEIDKFLCGFQEGPLSNHSSSNNSNTLWSRCRVSCRALNVSIHNATTNITISTNDTSSANSEGVTSYLHRHCKNMYASKLMSLPDQGKVARCLQSCHFHNTNSWICNGTGMCFCDWRFIHQARTNTLPTDDIKAR